MYVRANMFRCDVISSLCIVSSQFSLFEILTAWSSASPMYKSDSFLERNRQSRIKKVMHYEQIVQIYKRRKSHVSQESGNRLLPGLDNFHIPHCAHYWGCC
jgi:hypothetical protein